MDDSFFTNLPTWVDSSKLHRLDTDATRRRAKELESGKKGRANTRHKRRLAGKGSPDGPVPPFDFFVDMIGDDDFVSIEIDGSFSFVKNRDPKYCFPGDTDDAGVEGPPFSCIGEFSAEAETIDTVTVDNSLGLYASEICPAITIAIGAAATRPDPFITVTCPSVMDSAIVFDVMPVLGCFPPGGSIESGPTAVLTVSAQCPTIYTVACCPAA